jgi:hypothetical protein
LPDGFDAITSGLVLNFLTDAEKSLSALMPLLKDGGQMSAFIWDYAGHYQPMRYFWEAAKQTTPKAEKFDPGTKYSICKNTALIDLFRSIGLSKIEFTVIEKIATFKNFDDYWNPLLAAQGSLTEFLSLLDEKEKNYLKGVLRHKLPIALNGEIKLIISALCVKGMKAE